MTAAIGALAADKPETARKFIDQLLDQGDLEAALAVISTAEPAQLLEPDIAFVRGRLVWQQMVTGLGPGTAFDAQRYWTNAVESNPDFLAAWVALGFANYELGDFQPALAAWERAVALDRQQLRDVDPSGQLQVASDFTPNAYAGLAMGYQKLSELSPLEQEQERYQQRADTYFAQAISMEPLLLNPEALALEWLWSPSLIGTWQTALERISTNSATPGAD
jgi:tetratricopeptide (TPR) repeat protein